MTEIWLGLYFVASVALFAYGLNSYYLLYLAAKLRPKEFGEFKVNQKRLPKVTVQLPIYNELNVAARLITAVLSFNYPRELLEIQVLDDSTDATRDEIERIVQRAQQRGFRIKHLWRENREGYKGGALREGLAVATGEFIAIFDADFVPPPNFLLRSLPPFYADERIGLVQARWGHLNSEYSLLTKAQAMGIDGHFLVEQPARSMAGLFLNFNGTAGVWRKETIVDAGNWQSDTLTEDLDLSYRAQLNGWKIWYMKDLVCPAELPAQMAAFKSQQRRWAKGSIQTAIKLYPEVLRSPLSLKVKIESFFHLTGYMVHPLMVLVALTAPIVVMNQQIFSHFPGIVVLASLLSIAGFGPPVLYTYAQWKEYPDHRRVLRLPMLMIGGTGLAVSNTLAIFEAVVGKHTSFVRTPKAGSVGKGSGWTKIRYKGDFDRWALVELLLAFYVAIGALNAAFLGDLALLPFLLLYMLGFGYVGLLTLISV